MAKQYSVISTYFSTECHTQDCDILGKFTNEQQAFRFYVQRIWNELLDRQGDMPSKLTRNWLKAKTVEARYELLAEYLESYPAYDISRESIGYEDCLVGQSLS